MITKPAISYALVNRLQAKKAYAAKYPSQTGDWKKSTHVGRNPWCVGPRDNEAVSGHGIGKAGRYYIFDAGSGSYYWRDMGYADALKPRAVSHTGWWTDGFQDSKLRGVVYAMRTGKGLLVAPGYEESDSGQVVLFLAEAEICGKSREEDYDGDRYREAAEGMAIRADDLARIDAEKAMYDSEAYGKEEDARDLYEGDYAELRGDVRECLDKIRAHRLGLAEALSKQVELFPMPGRAPGYSATLRRRLVEAFDLESREAGLRERLAELLEQRGEIHAKARDLREEAAWLRRMAS